MSATLTTLVATVATHPWGPGPWNGGPWAAGFGWVALLVPIVITGLIVFAILFSASRRRRYGWGPGPYGRPPFMPPSGDAERTLADRFARGDIDEQEYRARLEVLRANRGEL